jgi:hypothetical protein
LPAFRFELKTFPKPKSPYANHTSLTMGSECVHRAVWAWNHLCPQELKGLSAAI